MSVLNRKSNKSSNNVIDLFNSTSNSNSTSKSEFKARAESQDEPAAKTQQQQQSKRKRSSLEHEDEEPESNDDDDSHDSSHTSKRRRSFVARRLFIHSSSSSSALTAQRFIDKTNSTTHSKKAVSKSKTVAKKDPIATKSSKSSKKQPQKTKKQRFRRSTYEYAIGETLTGFANNDRDLFDTEITKTLDMIIALNPNSYTLPPLPIGQYKYMMEDKVVLDQFIGIKQGSADYIVLIANTGASESNSAPLHWITVLIDQIKRDIYFVDSMGCTSKRDAATTCMMEFKQLLEKDVEPRLPVGTEFSLETVHLEVQNDDFNCGTYALMIANQFLKDRDVQNITTEFFEKINIQEQRRRMSDALYKNNQQ